MAALKTGFKLLRELAPLPGIKGIRQAFDMNESNHMRSSDDYFDQVEQEAAITRNVENLKSSLSRVDTIDHTRQQELIR
ncbi:hypothetical protein FRC12_000650 [Ceratobasidium sp. 428]|nr:hypothetical protein FRC12_000650 [Ceratobasidium sp. 428]